MAWVYLVFAGLFEVVGVMGINRLNRERNIKSVALLFGGFLMSFLLLSLAMRTLPMGTSYAVWTGIGTVGSALVGMLFFGESKDWRRLLFIAIVLCSVVGLKLTA